MKKYEYILFDLDGTLTDSSEGIMKSILYALDTMGIERPSEETLRLFIGPTLDYSYRTYMKLDEDAIKEGIRLYRDRYSKVGKFENRPYDGIKDALALLKNKGCKLLVASGKPETFVNDILEHFDLMKYFDFCAGSTLDGVRSKKDDIIAYAFRNMGITPDIYDKVLMVGDRKFDVEGAKSIGIDCLGVRYGFAPQGELEEAGATYIADDMNHMIKMFEEM